MIACASAPARKASVTNPARSECPPNLATCVAVNPAAAARRRIISLIACPVIACGPMAGGVHRGEQRPRRVPGLVEPGAAATMLRIALPVASPAARGGGLAAEHGH